MAVRLHHCRMTWWGHKSGFNQRSEEVSEAFPFTPLHQGLAVKALPDMFYKSSIMLTFTAGRKHLKSVRANTGGDFMSTDPIIFMGKVVALSCSDARFQRWLVVIHCYSLYCRRRSKTDAHTQTCQWFLAEATTSIFHKWGPKVPLWANTLQMYLLYWGSCHSLCLFKTSQTLKNIKVNLRGQPHFRQDNPEQQQSH